MICLFYSYPRKIITANFFLKFLGVLLSVTFGCITGVSYKLNKLFLIRQRFRGVIQYLNDPSHVLMP